jgi:polar amino acid transport system substrate-binding protein
VRKFAALVAVAALTAGLAACGGDDDDDASGSDATTTSAADGGGECSGPQDAYVTDVGNVEDFTPINEDTLTVVTSLPGPGFWEGSDDDPTAVNSGFEYDLAHAMREAFGLANLEVRNESFDAIVAGTVTDYDIALSQVSITCERAQVVDFTEPYFESNQGVLIAADSGVSVSTVDEARAIRWGVQTGTTAIDLLDTLGPDEEPAVYQQLPDAYTALEAGQVDAVLIDTAINLGQAARSGGRLEVVSQFEQPGGPDQYGGLLPDGSDDAGAFNAVLQELKSSGTLDQLTQDQERRPSGRS